jgi:hypothetical protein
VSVGRTSGSIYTLSQGPNPQYGVPIAIASIASSGNNAPIPLFQFPYADEPLFPTMVVLEPPAATS